MRTTAHIFYSTRKRRDYVRRHGLRLPPGLIVALALTVGVALRLMLGG